ncbi:mucin-21 [Drosophila serrata]|uniref:mucin-21 n=1 Tax=Drosophila serrata TaxID=7274 RepID=UPI000A1D1586|nr:mucin-21 [Drosophila serrata]
MIYTILVLCLLGSGLSQAAQLVQEQDLNDKDLPRLAGIYVKDGNENGQLRFLASGLSSSSNSNTGLNSALNQYITNKQDMLEQLRPATTSTGTGLSTVTGTTTTGTGTATASNLVTTTGNGAIYVNLGNAGSSSSSSSSSTSATNSAINQAIYGSSPIADLLPQIVGQAVASRRRPVNRRRVPAGNRRRVNKRRGSVNNNNQIQRRRRRGNNRGKNKAQVMVVRPNRG